MEIKKNPSKDLTRQTKKFFLIGLSISLAIVITAFEWRTLKENLKPRVYNPQEAQIDWIIPITNFEIPPLKRSDNNR